MLDYKVYKEKLDRLKAAKREFKQEECLWEERLLKFTEFFKKNQFLIMISRSGQYRYTDYRDFYPAIYMSHNQITVTKDFVSMVGIDCENDEIGVMEIKLEDFFREDYEDYFLKIYQELKEEKDREETKSKEKKERELYEELRKKYGDS